MPRQSFSDITPPSSKRTIRDIPVPIHRKPAPEPEEITPPPPPPPPPPRSDMMSNRSRRPRRFSKVLTIIIGVIVLGLLGLFGSQYLRVSATVMVTEKQKTISIDGTFIAKKNPGTGELAFTTVTASKDDSKTVPATGDKQVSNPASGTIVIYNNYSSATQRLIKNTRFETADGRIYRINQSVTVPGKDKNTGTPGSVEAVVYADAAGADYNIGLSDFTIPGFKGDPRYSKFYARSKTPMTGGFVGSIKTAAAADLKKAQNDLESSLRADLTKSIQGQVPLGSVLFGNAIYFDFEVTSPPDSNQIQEKATAYGLLFDSQALSQTIAEAALGGSYTPTDPVMASRLSSITFTSIPADARPWETGVVSFSLNGTTTINWIFDQNKFKQDLSGQMKNKSRIADIMSAYQDSIESANVQVQPFWKSTLPSSPNMINLKITNPVTP